MLDYLKHGIIGDYAQQIAEGVSARYDCFCNIFYQVFSFSFSTFGAKNVYLYVRIVNESDSLVSDTELRFFYTHPIYKFFKSTNYYYKIWFSRLPY